MALYGGRRDAKFIKSINLELMKKVIDTEIGYYKVIPEENESNIYGESSGKVWYYPIKIHAIIDRTERDFNEAEGLGQGWTQTATFGFFRDDLQSKSLHPEIGDILEWDNDYYEIDTFQENQYFAGKNQDTWFKGSSHGYNISIVVSAHITRKNIPNLDNVRSGITPGNTDRNNI